METIKSYNNIIMIYFDEVPVYFDMIDDKIFNFKGSKWVDYF